MPLHHSFNYLQCWSAGGNVDKVDDWVEGVVDVVVEDGVEGVAERLLPEYPEHLTHQPKSKPKCWDRI